MKNPMVSVLLYYYNDADFLKASIDSVLNQDYQDFELILLNHATNDNCCEIAHSYDDERIIHIDKDFNYGAGCGLLLKDMMKQVHGKYIKFCCADDVLQHDCLSTLVDFMENNDDCACVCSRMNFINSKGKNIQYKIYNDNIQDFKDNNLLKIISNGENRVYYPTVMMKKDVLEKLTIDNSFIMMLDVSLWTQLLCYGYKIYMIDKKLVNYRIHNGQSSKKFDKCSFIERIALADIFYKISDINIIKDLCQDVEYLKFLTDSDIKYFPFVMAIHNLKSDNISFFVSGYRYIHDLMNDEHFCDDIKQKFGFTVADFRNLYTNSKAFDNMLDVEYKKLSFIKLLKLIARKIFRVLTPKFYRNNLRKIKGALK